MNTFLFFTLYSSTSAAALTECEGIANAKRKAIGNYSDVYKRLAPIPPALVRFDCYPARLTVRDFKVIGVTKLNIACFNCESTSSAIVTTSSNRVLKSTPHKFLCKVLKMLACKIRDSSTTIVAV
jgi:hypothetical protein